DQSEHHHKKGKADHGEFDCGHAVGVPRSNGGQPLRAAAAVTPDLKHRSWHAGTLDRPDREVCSEHRRILKGVLQVAGLPIGMVSELRFRFLMPAMRDLLAEGR